jgi:hypothetical protein
MTKEEGNLSAVRSGQYVDISDALWASIFTELGGPYARPGGYIQNIPRYPGHGSQSQPAIQHHLEHLVLQVQAILFGLGRVSYTAGEGHKVLATRTASLGRKYAPSL